MAGKKPGKRAAKDEVLELSLPDELFDKVAELSEKDTEALTSILQSILGGQPRFGVKEVVISRQSDDGKRRETLRYYKPC